MIRLRRLWYGMMRRCYNSEDGKYYNYGARGITVCEQWKSNFHTFKDWALNNGYEDNLIIDRIDNYAGYSPENCRWVDYKLSSRNKRDTVYVEAFGERKLLLEWSEDIRCKVSYNTLYRRLFRDYMKPEEAISTYPSDNFKNYEAFGEIKSIFDWCLDIRCKVVDKTLKMRIYRGWNIEEAITKPSR